MFHPKKMKLALALLKALAQYIVFSVISCVFEKDVYSQIVGYRILHMFKISVVTWLFSIYLFIYILNIYLFIYLFTQFYLYNFCLFELSGERDTEVVDLSYFQLISALFTLTILIKKINLKLHHSLMHFKYYFGIIFPLLI